MEGPLSSAGARLWCATPSTTPFSSSDTPETDSGYECVQEFCMHVFRLQSLQRPQWLKAGTAAQIKTGPVFPDCFFDIFSTVTQLMVNVDRQQEWRECTDISGLHLPTGYFFGASSATGDLSGMKQRLQVQRGALKRSVLTSVLL